MTAFENPDISWRANTESHQLIMSDLLRGKTLRWEYLDAADQPNTKALAQDQYGEFQEMKTRYETDVHSIREADQELLSGLQEEKALYENFSLLPWFENFLEFLRNWQLTHQEQSTILQGILDKAWIAKRAIRQHGFPKERFDLVEFSERLWIQWISDFQNDADNAALVDYLSAIPSLKAIDDVPEIEPLLDMLRELENSGGASAEQMHKIVYYLVWQDGKSGQLDTILEALHRKDAENLAKGKRTNHLQSFSRTMRAFSPGVAHRIDQFRIENEAGNSIPEMSVMTNRAAIVGSFPEGADIRSLGNEAYASRLNDGTLVRVGADGEASKRSLSLEGAWISIETDIAELDLSEAQREITSLHQNLGSKIERSKQAVAFLENPNFADASLADLQEGLTSILGYAAYRKTGIGNFRDHGAIINVLKRQVQNHETELARAKREFAVTLQKATEVVREKNREGDEKIKSTLRALKNSTLGLWDMDHLIANIEAGFILPDIWVPFDTGNIDLARQNFWEPRSETHNPTKHIEYIYRIANKVLTGSPDGMVDGKLVGFSLDQAIRNPNVAQKTDAETKELLLQSGVWSEVSGADKAKARQTLSAKGDQFT